MNKILIVDDQPEIVELIKNRLESHDFNVVTACDGEEGLFKTEYENPDLIILDVMMPVINGYEVCARLKHNEKYAHIPILILTAKIRYDQKKTADQCGADAFLPKPYTHDMLFNTIDHLLSTRT